MGSVNSRKKKLYLDFRYRGVRCREQTKLVDSPQNRKKLEILLKRIESEIHLNLFDYAKYFPNGSKVDQFSKIERQVRLSSTNKCPSFEDFAEVWFIEKQPEWRDTQIKNVEDILRLYLQPNFGSLPLNEICKQDILFFRSELVKGRFSKKQLSASRVNHIMTPLRMILLEGADRFNYESPWKNVKPIPVPKTDIQPFTLPEVKKIIKHVRADFRAYYIVRFFAGLRTGEIDGLTWECVDFHNRIIQIRQSLVNGKFEQPKTRTSFRDVDMCDAVFEALSDHMKLYCHSKKYVFSNRKGNPLSHRNVSKRVWYPLLQLLNIVPRNPYQTRHTAATFWLASGESPEWIARQLGHANTNMLFTVYSRFVPNLTRKDGTAFEAFLNNSEY
ncbi:site-specific integrase [Shewanella sp. 202IG2-18]|uniref:Arm DNA-binding domain-containing protein n=1 Tax=Parashewanella hymeniacidonis TaxID=2807618 RepID=UPI001961D6B3|nr:DUF3596 domain-containing protein [Parashewanella hymeniacidonis]MBM7072019.1 site-specific integrase [Parashewanella hymeniacidonis]